MSLLRCIFRFPSTEIQLFFEALGSTEIPTQKPQEEFDVVVGKANLLTVDCGLAALPPSVIGSNSANVFHHQQFQTNQMKAPSNNVMRKISAPSPSGTIR